MILDPMTALLPHATFGHHVRQIAQCSVLQLTVLMVWLRSKRLSKSAAQFMRTESVAEFMRTLSRCSLILMPGILTHPATTKKSDNV